MSNDTRLRRLALILSLAGLLVAGYLVWVKLMPGTPICTSFGDCEAVNNSAYSSIAGIPIALLGALAYAAIAALLLLETRLPVIATWGPLAQFGLSLTGMLYSAYLTYIEVAVLHKICPFCVTSAILISVLTVLFGVRLRKALS